ncbi:MAG: hypothetical protein GY822_32390 [Deltaproteobacteria bacterium]|nr:hypothetical protein [Deltaproteobacteria bacterium]
MSANSLETLLLSDESKRPHLLKDCVKLIDDEVKAKSGLTGVAIKGGYKIVCKIKPGIILESMDSLLNDFVKRVEPFWEQHVSDGGNETDFAQSLATQKEQVADALLGITDDRASRAKQRTMKKAYEKLRPTAKKHVAEAVPGVGRTLGAHL